MMRTSITLDNLRFRARHGVMEQERAVGNTFVVALRLDYPFEEATTRLLLRCGSTMLKSMRW